jgi:L-fucose isomerase-like protein
MANPARIDAKSNSLTLAHCTVVRDLTTGYHIRSHFETGKGVALQGELAPGPVTLLRLGGKDLRSLWIAEGEILRPLGGNSEELCRTQATVKLSKGHVGELLRRPLGNHIVLVQGSHADRLEGYCDEFVAHHRR